MTKNPWIAGILNIIPGLGYLYLGKRKVFAGLLLLSLLITIMDKIFNPWPDMSTTLFYWIEGTLILSAFFYDAFMETKNKPGDKMKKKNPWIAFILNVIPGLGYLYLGKRKVFSYLFFLFIFITIMDAVVNPLQETPLATPLFLTGAIVILF